MECVMYSYTEQLEYKYEYCIYCTFILFAHALEVSNTNSIRTSIQITCT